MCGGSGESFETFGDGVYAHTIVDGDPSYGGEHADAAVLELGFAEVVHGDIVGDTEGVESDVSYVS